MADPETAHLIKLCDDTEQAAQAALSWFAAYPDRISAQRPVLDKEFRLAAVEARKLRAAVERPVGVGVYGLSQAGKSYLISTLARPPGKELMARLDRDYGFLAEINPESEKEATGLVTRFTMRAEAAPAGFPVCLRLLSETDLVKILANSWYRDAIDADSAGAVPPEEIAQKLDDLERETAGARGAGEVTREDIWDLQSYIESEFRSYITAQAFRGSFWDRAASIAPSLPLERRIELYALLWNRFQPLTDLLVNLTRCLRALRFDRDAWAPIAALVPKSESVLRVDTLDELANPACPKVEIDGSAGGRCTLSRAELTALIAELQITMAELPWPILKTTDLLDFPGARERTGKSHSAEISSNPRMLGEFFLRGKVAYLFERYAAERELNTLLLCIRESNNPYDSAIRASIRGWIQRTHGEKPEDRARVDTSLFVVLTRMDMHFNRTPGRNEDAPSSDLWDARIKASLLQPLQEANGWLDAWHPGKKFNNTLLARNPGRSQSLSVPAADGSEARFLPGIEERIKRWGVEFSSRPSVIDYVRAPQRAWDEVFRLNDAGMSYLIECLTPVCRPDLKLAQLTNQVAACRERMRRRLNEWHVSGDLAAEKQKRITALEPALSALETCAEKRTFGALLMQFHFDAAEARQVLLRNQVRTEPPGGPAPNTGRVADLRAALRRGVLPGASNRPEPTARDPGQEGATALVSAWIAKLRQFANGPVLHGYFGLDAAAADALVSEMAATAKRTEMQERLANTMRALRGSLRFDQLAERSAVAASQLINEQVNFLGWSQGGVLATGRPKIEGSVAAFEPVREPETGFELEDTEEQAADMFFLAWIVSLADSVERNVFDAGGAGMVDARENDALGAVLALL